jgi:hypothetical protein
MTSSSSLALLRNALASRRKAKALALRLALAKASAMETVYGSDLARPFWVAVYKAEKAVAIAGMLGGSR